MSLISDALRKAQKEREKVHGELGEPQIPGKRRRNLPGKRVIFYGSLGGIVITVLVLVTIFSSQNQKTQMKAINIRGSQGPAVKKPPRPKMETPPSTPAGKPAGVTEKIQKQEKEQAGKPVQKQVKQAEPAIVKDQIAKKKKPAVTREKQKPAPKPSKSKKPKQIKKPVKSTSPELALSSFEESMRQGDDLMAEKNYIQAAEKYKSALKVKKTVDVYLKLYAAFRALKNPVLTRAYIDDGLKHFPDDFLLNKISTIIYIRAKKYQKALAGAKKAVQLNPDDYTLFTYLGLCYFHGKDFTNALVNFQKSLDLNSDAVENYYYIGLIFDNQKKYKRALEYYTVFSKLNPDNKNFKHKEWIMERMRMLQAYLEQQ